MKDKLKRAVAAGLLALTVSNFTACAQIDIQNSTTYTDANGNIIQSDGTTASPSKPSGLSGGVWDAIKNKGELQVNYFLSTGDLKTHGIPLQFLMDEGLLYVNESDEIRINGKQANKDYAPFKVYAYIDKNTDANDVYLLMQYASDDLGQNETRSDIYLATWRLKYVLDDDDYQTFLNLEDDFRMKFFIQEMDNQYQPEVLSKSVATQEMLLQGSHVRDEHWTKKGFPYIFIDSIDYNNQTIRFGAMSGSSIKYMIVDIRKGAGWEWAKIKMGYTDEECEQNIKIKTMNTPVGICLTEFDVADWRGGYTTDACKEAFKNTTDIEKVDFIDIDSNQIEYIE